MVGVMNSVLRKFSIIYFTILALIVQGMVGGDLELAGVMEDNESGIVMDIFSNFFNKLQNRVVLGATG